MVNEFIKLFTGYEGDFGIADMSKTSLDSRRIFSIISTIQTTLNTNTF